MKFNTIVSVDPGLAGGLSLFVNNQLVSCLSMPTVRVETKKARYKFDLLNGKKQFIKSGKIIIIKYITKLVNNSTSSILKASIT